MDDRYKIDDNDAYNWTLKKKLSEYTQEELAKELIDYKKEVGYDTHVRIGGEYGIVITTIGLETVEEVLAKYQETLDKAGMPRTREKEEISNNDTLVSNDNLPENNKESEPIKQEGKYIMKPLSKLISDYTREELAHLVMDGKEENKEYGFKYKYVDFSSFGCNTVEDFLNKYKEQFDNLGIKSEVKEEPNVYDKIEEVVNNPNLNLDNLDLVHVLFTIIDKKNQMNIESEYTYKGNIINTYDCNTRDDIITKYKDLIAANMDEEITEVFKTESGNQAKYLFQLARGNVYGDNDPNYQKLVDVIQNKEAEYKNVIAKKDGIDFNDSLAVHTWLNELTPYINTHALTLESDTSLEPNVYLLNLMNEKGYTTEITANNFNDYNRYEITDKLRELEKYKFFVREYPNLPIDMQNLDSEKTISYAALEETKHLTSQFALYQSGIAKIEEKVKETREDTNNKVEELNKDLEEEKKKEENSFNSLAPTKEEKEELKAGEALYRIPSDDTTTIADFIDMVDNPTKKSITDKINALIKDQEEREIRLNNLKETYKGKAEIILNRIHYLKDKYKISIEDKLDDIVNNFKPSVSQTIEKLTEEAIAEIEQEEREEKIANKKNKKGGIFSKIKNAFGKETKEDGELKVNFEKTQEEIDDDNDIDLSVTPSSTAPQIQESETTEEVVEEPVVEEVNEEVKGEDANDSIEDENGDDIDLSLPDQDSIDNFTPIRSIKGINKDLYEAVQTPKYKESLSKAIKKLNESKKAVITGAILAVSIVAASVSIGANAKSATTAKSANNSTAIETNINTDTNDTTLETTNDIVETSANEIKEEKIEVNNQVEEDNEIVENSISLEEASNKALDDVLNGQANAYQSSMNALEEANGISSDKLYTSSWENANGGTYYTLEGDSVTRVSDEEAKNIYENGGKLVQAVSNDGTVIGYVSVDNQTSEKSM